MQIIDFKKKGNLVRFYLGEKTAEWGWTRSDYKQENKGKLETPSWLQPSDTYYGDDWDDRPYEHNAGGVYEEFIKGYVDFAFDFDALVLEPADSDSYNSSYCKNDMVNRQVPCIIVVSKDIAKGNWSTNFNYWLGCDGIKKFYFGDVIDEYFEKGSDNHIIYI